MNCCWWCTLDIKGEPLRIPHRYDDRRRKFHLSGQFCSWECMKSYNIHENRRNFGEIQNNITLMKMKMYGINKMRTQCAPHRNTLTKFGGELSEEEFRAHAKSPVTPVLSMPDTEHFVHNLIVLTEKPLYTQPTQTSSHPNKEETRRLAEINTASGRVQKTDSLRLKRPVPIKLSKNNIESALGLTRKATC